MIPVQGAQRGESSKSESIKLAKHKDSWPKSSVFKRLKKIQNDCFLEGICRKQLRWSNILAITLRALWIMFALCSSTAS